ncbi:MAG: ribosome recycling factor [Selenomonadaceae bacterium]|nr:ribosome recycling factor [Selenomonadaceae bacterium]
MTKDVIKSAEDRLGKTLDGLKKDYGTLRAGRAAPSLLDKVLVDYYGTSTPVNQIANVTVPEPRMIMIKPYDRNSLKDIEKAIQKSDLGLTPNNDGTTIRLQIPQPTQERRKELVKVVSKKAEEAKVAMRNIRRDANESIKKLEKDKQITEDDRKYAQEEMQKLLDKYIKLVDGAKATKEKEVMEV